MSVLEIYKSGEEWRWRLKADNGEIVASGEGYTTKDDAVRGTMNATQALINAETTFPDDE